MRQEETSTSPGRRGECKPGHPEDAGSTEQGDPRTQWTHISVCIPARERAKSKDSHRRGQAAWKPQEATGSGAEGCGLDPRCSIQAHQSVPFLGPQCVQAPMCNHPIFMALAIFMAHLHLAPGLLWGRRTPFPHVPRHCHSSISSLETPLSLQTRLSPACGKASAGKAVGCESKKEPENFQ